MMPNDMIPPVTPEMGNRALPPEADLHATPTQQTKHLGLAKAADIHTTESNTLLGMKNQSSPALASFANLSLDSGRYDPSARYSPPSHGGCILEPDYKQVVYIYEQFRKDPVYNRMLAVQRLVEFETGITRSSIVNKILQHQEGYNRLALREHNFSIDELLKEIEEFSKVRPFLSSGLDITTYSQNSVAVGRKACRPLEAEEFSAIRSQTDKRADSFQRDSQSNAGSSVSQPGTESIATRRSGSASLAAEAALATDAVKEESAPLHKLMDGTLLYESLVNSRQGCSARVAMTIEDKDSNGDGSPGSANNSHKQCGTYLRTSHSIDGCAYGIVFHGTRFRPYQLIDCNTLAVWVPTQHIKELFPTENEGRTNYTISWHTSIEKFRNQKLSMFTFDCGYEDTAPEEPQMLIKFICEIAHRISIMVSHQQDFPSDTKQIERVKNYNPYLDFTRFPPVDFSGLINLEGECVATRITITDVTLANVVPPARPKKAVTGGSNKSGSQASSCSGSQPQAKSKSNKATTKGILGEESAAKSAALEGPAALYDSHTMPSRSEQRQRGSGSDTTREPSGRAVRATTRSNNKERQFSVYPSAILPPLQAIHRLTERNLTELMRHERVPSAFGTGDRQYLCDDSDHYSPDGDNLQDYVENEAERYLHMRSKRCGVYMWTKSICGSQASDSQTDSGSVANTIETQTRTTRQGGL